MIILYQLRIFSKNMLAPQGNVFQDSTFREAFEPIQASVNDPFARKVVVEKAKPDIVKLNGLVEQSNRVLFTTKAIFPFDLFPNMIRLDENKLDIINNLFFFSEQVFPIAISDIKNVTVTTDLFFATLCVEIGGYETNPGPIKFLPKGDAVKLRRLIFGLMEAKKENIDLGSIPINELVPKLEQIGRVRGK